MSRTVNGDRLFDAVAREMLRRQIWQVAEFCGVEVVTYTILSNHFHVLVRVPKQEDISDTELLRRARVLYPKITTFQPAALSVNESETTENSPHATTWRQRLLAQMGDVSQFMKLLKQRFSTWYNKTHQRFGTLWAERFKSVLVEPGDWVLRTMAAYIDLNCVRAGLVVDPVDYRFCGYAEAVAGSEAARAGIRSIMGKTDWAGAHAHYRETLFGTGAAPREAAAAIPQEELQRVISVGGKLPLAQVLRCRIRYFTDGAVLGSKAYVATQLAQHFGNSSRRPLTKPRALPTATDWGELTVLRSLRGPVFS